MLYKTENELKMALGLNAWRNLLNDKIVKFQELMPNIGTDVMLDIVGQLPQFWNTARTVLKDLNQLSVSHPAKIDADSLESARAFLDRDLDDPAGNDPAQAVHLDAIMAAAVHVLPDLQDNPGCTVLTKRILAEKGSGTRSKLIALLVYIGGRMPDISTSAPV